MKTLISEKLREEGYDVHRCAPGSDGNCYYLFSERRARDYGDKDGRIFKAVRETPAGDLEFGATLAFFVSRSAQAAAKTKGLMGDFESFVAKAGVAHLLELLKRDLSSTPHRDIELNSRSPDEAFALPAEPHPLVEQRDLRFTILRVLAEKHSAGLKRVSKDALLEELCTNIDWVDRALVILGEQNFVDGALRGNMKLLPAGYLEAEKMISQPAAVVAPAPEPVQDEDAATAAAAEVPETAAVNKTSRHAFDLFICYASEDRSAVEGLVAVLEGHGLKVWWDKGQITLGDRLSAKIDEGLRNSRYGVVIISGSFIAKPWPESELRSMINRSTSSGEKVILPVLLGLTHDQVAAHYPLIADIVTTQFDGDLERLADEISTAIGRDLPESPPTAPSKLSNLKANVDGDGSPIVVVETQETGGQTGEERKQVALRNLAELRGEGVVARNHFGSLRLVTEQARQQIHDICERIYEQAMMVSASEAELLKTLDTFDPMDHPRNVHDKPEVLHFSELLKRVADLIKRHQ